MPNANNAMATVTYTKPPARPASAKPLGMYKAAGPTMHLTTATTARNFEPSGSSSGSIGGCSGSAALRGGSLVGGAYGDAPLGKIAKSNILDNDDGARAAPPPPPPPRGGGGERAARGATLAEMTGRDFAEHVFGRAFEALGGRDDVLVVLACGSKGPADALGGALGGAAPRNFLPCGFVPQLDVLPLCDAFVTHGGAGSVRCL